MRQDDLTPLDQIPAFNDVDRERLRSFWITTAEEFIATARTPNQQHTSGLGAMGAVLGRTPVEMEALFHAATEASPRAAAFDAPAAREYGTGLLLDDLPEEDAAAFSLPSLPPEVSLVDRLPPAQDQGTRNTCVAFSLVAAIQCLRNDPTDLSEQFLFWLCKQHDQRPDDARGTLPIVGANVLRTMGVCREEFWPYHRFPLREGGREHNVGQGPPPNRDALVADAAARTIGGARLVSRSDVNAIRAEVAAGRPVLIGLPVPSFWAQSSQATVLGRLRPLLPGEQAAGGHAMCVVGYRDDPGVPGGGYLIVRNSWGTGWASENPDGPGYAHIPYRVIADHCLVALVLEPAPVDEVPAGSETASLAGAAADTRIPAIVAEAEALSPAALSRLISALAARLATLLASAPAGAAPGTVPEPADAATFTPLLEPALATSTGAIAAADPSLEDALDDVPPRPTPIGETIEAIEQDGELIVPNGIDPTTGLPRYRLDFTGARRVAAANRWDDNDPERMLHAAIDQRAAAHLGIIYGFSLEKLAINEKGAGWGLVIPAEEDVAILKALSPLIKKRCEDQDIKVPPLTFAAGETCGAWLRRVVGDEFVNQPMQASPPVPIFLYDAQKDRTVYQWCARHGIAVETVDPRRGVPYYLLLVGRPGARFAGDPHIPFGFQYDLDFHWGVGRIGFTDAAGNHRYAAYTAYAEQLVATERGQVAPRDRAIAYVATRHELDRSTMFSSNELVGPLLHGRDGREPLATRFGFGAQSLLAEQATRSGVERLLAGEMGRPGLLFSATHGIDLPLDHPQQIMEQGALICQDWPGLGVVRREHWFAGDDLPERTDVAGLVGLCFACFSAGCPSHDQFRFSKDQPPAAIAPHAFLAQLPQRLLERGALAVLGHVDRAWSYSFRDAELGIPSQAQAFEDLLARIMDGKRLGEATDQFNTRQGQAAMRLTELLDKHRHVARPDAPFGLDTIGPRWAAFNDARGYSLFGDPAARLAVAPPENG